VKYLDYYSNNILRTESALVPDINEAKRVLQLLEEELNKFDNACGVAAIQIGIPLRLALIKTKHQRVELINPKITELSFEFTTRESCLSIPKFAGNIRRYQQITIINNVIDGDSFRTQTEVYYHDPHIKDSDKTAIAVQHEIDHMNGILISDKSFKPQPILSPIKVGRNDLCPCGSEKKYKKCCEGK